MAKGRLRGSARKNVLTSKAGQAEECVGKGQMFVRENVAEGCLMQMRLE